MKTYKIEVVEILRRTFDVEANSADEAADALLNEYPWSDEAPEVMIERINGVQISENCVGAIDEQEE